LGMLCGIRTFSLWSQVSQTSMSAVISLVSSLGSQPYPAKGSVFLAMGTDVGRFSTLSRSVFNMLKGVLLFAGMTGKPGEELDAETAGSVGVGSVEGGPGIGWGCNTWSMDIDSKRESVAR
jgi:hypothetical protein